MMQGQNRKKRQKKNKAEDWKVLEMKNQRDTIGQSWKELYITKVLRILQGQYKNMCNGNNNKK